MLSRIYPRVIDHVGELNPQLFREIQGRLKLRNVVLASAVSIIGQIFLYLYFQGMLPITEGEYSRYCTTISDSGVKDYYGGSQECITDLLGNLHIIKELWWLDIFTTMSIIGIFISLVVGSYMLIADISKEERLGTLNFIRLSPQSVFTILGGKILGVPILVYLFGALAIPLHLVAGLSAGIPFHLILGFYLVLAASCLFFYSVSILYSLVSNNLGNFQALLGGGMIFFFLLVMMAATLESHGSQYAENSLDWVLLFYPGTFLIYLVKSTFLAPDTIGYLASPALMNLNWYGQFFWQNSATGFAFMLANYGVWSFWLWRGLKRRFHNPLATVISKYDSYWLSACFIVFNLGFALQSVHSNSYSDEASVIIVQILNLILFLILIAALTPHRHTLQDWARFRHQKSRTKRALFRDVLLGEKSPAVMAIAVNVLIVTLYLTPSVLIFSFHSGKSETIMGFILGGAIILVYATVAQLLVMLKTNKRGLIATGGVAALMIAPFLSFAIFPHAASDLEIIGLFSPFPMVVADLVSSMELISMSIGYVVTLSALNWQIKRVLDKAGMSESKILLAEQS